MRTFARKWRANRCRSTGWRLNYAKATELQVTLQALLSTDCGGGTLQVVGGPAGAAGGDAAAGAAGGAAVPAPAPQSAQLTNQDCKPRGKVVAEAPTNTLVIYEAASRIDSLVSYARSFDLKPQQVNIRAKIIAINRTTTNDLGISYDLGSSSAFFNTLSPRVTPGGSQQPGEFQVTLGGEAFAGVANAGRTFKTGQAINLLYNTTIGNFSLTSFLDALTQEELSDVQAEPSVNTVDKREAKLFAGEHVSFLLTPQTAPGAIQAAAPQISALDVGITLTVTPSISANRTVRLTISAEQSAGLVFTVAGPNYSKRLHTTEVIVRDGETVVIAGLTQTQQTKTRRGIPLLMTLPMIGRLFSENSTVETKNDLLIMITPHIMDDPIPGPPGGN